MYAIQYTVTNCLNFLSSSLSYLPNSLFTVLFGVVALWSVYKLIQAVSSIWHSLPFV